VVKERLVGGSLQELRRIFVEGADVLDQFKGHLQNFGVEGQSTLGSSQQLFGLVNFLLQTRPLLTERIGRNRIALLYVQPQ
jgi:hypothetical protein